ncbi:MAG: ABC transporter permease [Eubacteriales bacterium]|nr:ABC transporter permease [Eubacteriales bacterium]MDD3289488.1 ABC transporter permease [Eubacteriales bacterium]MDD3863450.1 ABC transporter permease [Eubacteriales bacterium]MDD4444916.1 ABC transporter permease [Eubacteriales bacterium]
MNKKRIAKKLLYAAITIFFVLVFNYFLFRILPGDILSMLSRSGKTTPEMVANIREMYGLDLPWYQQFFVYLENLFTGDLGTSFIYKKPVAEVIGSRILPTVILLGVAEVLAIVVGIIFGIVSAWKRGKAIDTGLLSTSLLLYSMPTFWLGMMLILIFCVNLRLFPINGMVTPGRVFADTWAYINDVVRHMVLPMACMALVMIGEYAITMRSTMIDVLSEDYITTAKAKGFSNGYVLRRHAMPNAMLPMITLIAINLGLIVGGAIQIETVFSWPGLGNLMYGALVNRDYPLLQGVFLLTTVTVILANFLSDILYEVVDPRVKSMGG